MADGHVSLSSLIFNEENYDDNRSSIPPSMSYVRYLKTNKYKFYWLGSHEELFNFAMKYLVVKHDIVKLSVNETKKTIKAYHPIQTWYGTLQLQGSQAAKCKTILKSRVTRTSSGS